MPNDYAKIIVAASHGELRTVRNAMAVSGTINALKCQVEFRTPDWDASNKCIIFARGKATSSTPKEDIFPPQALDSNNETDVPAGALCEKYFSVGLIGVGDNYRIVTNWLHYKVEDGCYADGSATFDPPKSIYEQILEQLKSHKHDDRYYTKEESENRFISEDELVQPDWEQNDESALDYIKNRPIYEYKGLTVTEITTYAQANEAKTQYNNGTLKVVINGVEYTDFTYTSGTYSWTLSTSDGTYSMTGGYMNSSVTFAPSDAVWVMHTNTTIIVQLDEKYIPDTIARDADKMDAYNPSGIGSFSMNRKADTTIGKYSCTEGRNNTASGKSSYAEGEDSIASGDYSHAEGYNTESLGIGSHAEGNTTHATARASHAEGIGSRAEGDYSHAEGSTSQAYGNAAHAEGRYAIARGNYSHAEGGYVEAGSPYQHVQGKNNIIDSESKYAHIVGNGANNGERSNAHTLDWSGNAWFSGLVKIGGTGQDDEAAKEIATKEYIDNVVDETELNAMLEEVLV